MRLKVDKNLRIAGLNLKFIGSCQTNKSKLYNVEPKHSLDWLIGVLYYKDEL